LAALIAGVTFSALYGGMLAAAVFVRSAALSAATGGALFVAGIVAGYRDKIAPAFEPGASRRVFEGVTLFLPRVSALADTASDIAGSAPIDHAALLSQLAGLAVFGVAALLLGVARFEQRDY
jgi:Cu-processing system permease protein